MQTNDLTIIIPFLNEGIEVANTVQTIRQTAPADVTIIVINDNSTDDFDYPASLDGLNVDYHVNAVRLGVARTRDIGVALCQTPYFLLLDAHMRTYKNNWYQVLCQKLADNDRAIYCMNCKVLDINFDILRDRDTYGAHLKLDSLDTVWNYNQDQVENTDFNIPCVLGACYAVSKRYWDVLKGLEGLQFYGSDEAYMSIKTWMEGGNCVVIPELEIGHIFRKPFPYPVTNTNTIYNKVLVAETLFPEDVKAVFYQYLLNTYPITLQEVVTMINNNAASIAALKSYYYQTFTGGWERFSQINNSFLTIVN